MRVRVWGVLVGLGIAVALAAWMRMVSGDAAGLHWPESGTILGLRAGRLGVGLVVGGSLALCGTLVQSLVRNPLASPDLLGVSSGAGLGVAAAAYLGQRMQSAAVPAWGAEWAAALTGALTTLGFILWCARGRRTIEPTRLVLVGVIVGMIASGGTLLIRHLMPASAEFELSRWMLGAIRDDAPRGGLATGAGVLAASLVVSALAARGMDVASLSDDEARALGVRLRRLRLVLLLASGALATSSVVLAGPVAFVGLLCPHAARWLLGTARHGMVIPASAGLGAAAVVAADTASACVPASIGRVPLGVVTALVGGPVLLAMLRGMVGRSS